MGYVSSKTQIRGAQGLLAGTAAGLLWGFVFLAPHAFEGARMQIALGRFVVYGIASFMALLFRAEWRVFCLPLRVWSFGALMAFTGFVGYYSLVVWSMGYAAVQVTTLIVGVIPISVPLAGVLITRDTRLRDVVLPLALILAGLVAVDWKISTRAAGQTHFLALAAAITALLMWTYYSIANAAFLRDHKEISAISWSTVIGINTLWLAGALALCLSVFDPDHFDSAILLSGRYIGWSLVLGFGSSWAATLLWNVALRRIPVAIAGQLIAFETISGLIYVYCYDGRLPTSNEVAGIVLLLAGVQIGVRRFQTRAS